MYSSLPKMEEVVAPLWDLLEEVLDGGQLTMRVAKNKLATEE